MQRPLVVTLLPILALALLGGCATGPDRPPPEVAEPQLPSGADLAAVQHVATPPAVKPRKTGTPGKLTIRLKSQRFEYREGNELIHAGEVSSGSREHPTPKGSFRVLSKNKEKRSGKYTNYFDDPTPMPYAIQFNGPYYVHEGWLPGHADSHGCVRLHYEDAKFLFGRIRIGDRVAVVD